MNSLDRKYGNLEYEYLGESEVLATGGDGSEELLAEHFVVLVLWKIELCNLVSHWIVGEISGELTVEARMRTWQTILISIITMDIESAEPVHALQFLEAVEGNLRSTSHKLQ